MIDAFSFTLSLSRFSLDQKFPSHLSDLFLKVIATASRGEFDSFRKTGPRARNGGTKGTRPFNFNPFDLGRDMVIANPLHDVKTLERFVFLHLFGNELSMLSHEFPRVTDLNFSPSFFSPIDKTEWNKNGGERKREKSRGGTFPCES